MSYAPTFTMGKALSSMDLATVTPSFVTLGAPKDCSMTTFLPLGPMVTATASARRLQPSSIRARASLPCLMSLAAAKPRTAVSANGALRCTTDPRLDAERMVDSIVPGGWGQAPEDL